MRIIPDMEIRSTEYERAAEIFNLARKNVIKGSNTDFLICAVAERYHIPVFSLLSHMLSATLLSGAGVIFGFRRMHSGFQSDGYV